MYDSSLQIDNLISYYDRFSVVSAFPDFDSADDKIVELIKNIDSNAKNHTILITSDR